MANVIPILNARPTNPTQEEFLAIQKFGLQPYDRSPNDYLRFVAKIFTAWRDPEDNILNFDPFDDKYGVTGDKTSLTLQATADKSIIAYVDGYETSYHFVRLTTDENSTDLTKADNLITDGDEFTTQISENGDIITIDKSKYGEYHRFLIKPGICFIDNQLIQIVEETEWWFRVPTIKEYDANGNPDFELGQFIIDPLNVYSLLPNKNYKIILSYEYINQFESNSARLRFETDETAIDEPYFLIASFTTDKFGMVHQTIPVNEKSFEKFKYYIIKEELNESNGEMENRYYLKDINPQYLDKKYMVNHKNLFKHLQSQLLSILSSSKIANTFHCREITEEIDPSVSSGDFVYYDGYSKRWYPAEVSRQNFDKVVGLYLMNATEGTHFLFTSGIIEIDDTYTILDEENLVLRNLIPGAEYFLAEDTNTALNTMPFIDQMVIFDNRSTGYFKVTTEVIAKASSIEFEMIPTPGSGLSDFSVKRSFELDPNKGEQRISQTINWEFTPSEIALLPNFNVSGTTSVNTDKISFNVKLNMIESSIVEKNKEIIEDFKLYDNGDIEIDYIEDEGLPSEMVHTIKIEESHLYISTNGIPDTLLARGPGGSPVMKLLEVMETKTEKVYSDLGLGNDEYFVPPAGRVYNLDDIENELTTIRNDLNAVIYNTSPANFGLTDIMALLGNEVTKIDKTVNNLYEAKGILEQNFNAARLEFQAQETAHQIIINDARNEYRIVKNTFDSLTSQKAIITQKRNAVQYKLDELNNLISLLDAAKTNYGGSNLVLQDLIDNTASELADIQNEIDTLDHEILTIDTNAAINNTNTLAYLNDAVTNQKKSFDYRLSYYAVPAPTSIINYADKNMILQRALNNLKAIYEYTSQSESRKIVVKNAKKAYEDELTTYTNGVVGGIYTYAQQLLASNLVMVKKATYDEAVADYQTVLNKLIDARTIRDDYIRPEFLKAKNAIRAELFAKVIPNTDPNSSWGNANETTFKIKLSSPSSINLYFDFMFKEDTNDIMRITIPAGQIEATNTVFLQSLPAAGVDAGLPKWIVTDSLGDPVNDILNVNKLNQKLIDNHVLLTADASLKGEPELFTLSVTDFLSNPNTVNRPTQIPSKITSIIKYDDLFDLALTIDNEIKMRETILSSRDLKVASKENKENEYHYKERYKKALDGQLALGVTVVNEYDIQITYNTNLRNFYTYSAENVDIGLLGSNISYNVSVSKLSLIGTQLVSYGNDLGIKQANYQTALDDLRIATDIALGKYIDGVAETNMMIENKIKQKDRIIAMFNLYKERTNIVINIYNNINSILESGIFNNEWVTTDTFLLHKFQYENALENQLKEILDDTLLIPVSSIIVPKYLEYTIGTNGLQYPMDLQPWVFVKTSGKISTKHYPGATSVGIALNENTLILNIKHNNCGDISEFLNVYGNETDFIDQLTSKYYSVKSTALKLDSLKAYNKLLLDENLLTNKLNKNQSIITRTVNGKTITLTTSLSTNEMNILDTLVGALISSSNGTLSDTELTMNKKEFLIRLIYSKFYGKGSWYNSYNYLYSDEQSTSSWYSIPGNPILMGGKDPFNSTVTSGTITDLNSYIQYLFTKISGGTLLLTTMQELFQKKLPLYKDLDIVNYILSILPEPLIDYNAKFVKIKAHYEKILKSQLDISRYILQDNPYSVMDDFENPSLTDDYIMDPARITAVSNTFDGLIASETLNKVTEETKVINDRIDHSLISDRIAKYDLYKTYLNSLKEDVQVSIRYFEEKLKTVKSLKIYLNEKIKELDKDYLIYYNRMNKLPTVMWDIFRITNFQRTKWNYTYLVLRILGMQKELNNTIINNSIQYSPINAELAELKIKRNSALANNETAQAHMYDIRIKSIEQKKKNFYNMLQNMVNEFNVIQRAYSKTTITPETPLATSFIVDELYMQDPDEYNLSYSFAPYPAYKELV
jgi:hypothetical protein